MCRVSQAKESQWKSCLICPLSPSFTCQAEEFSRGHWELCDPPALLSLPPYNVFPHFFFLLNAADFRLAWEVGRNWRLTDSSRLDWETNKLWRESWRFASEKIRVASGSSAKIHRCFCHTVMATEALCFSSQSPHCVSSLYQRDF